MPLLSIGRGAKCVESQELTAVLPALSPKIKRQLGLGHLTPVDLRRKKQETLMHWGQSKPGTPTAYRSRPRGKNHDLHWRATIMWLPYCLGSLDAMCTTSSVSNWKDKKPHKIAMTNALPNCEPMTIAIL